MRRVLAGIAALVLLWLGLAIGLFVLPRDDHPTHADAVIVLSGDRHYRIDRALQLMRRGVAKNLVISGWPDRYYTLAAPYCEGRSSYHVVCLWPKPDSTRGEAEMVSRLARERGWRDLVVVTSGYHVFRARTLFRRCWSGGLQVVSASYSEWRIVEALPLESAKLLLALTARRGC